MPDPLELCARDFSAPPARIWKPPDKPVAVVMLGPVIGHWLHWYRKRTVPCSDASCKLCKSKVPARWQGYAPGAEKAFSLTDKGHVFKWERIVIPIAPELDEMLSLAAEWPLLLDCVPRSGKKGFEVKRVQPMLKTDGLPTAFDCRLVLYRVFGIRPPAANPKNDRCDIPPSTEERN